ncbi:hypothetical protein N0V94_001259 [Neodidymelliopsis sp. IMI 364377]|nr:hypothetical protein N0V94_001259 [Neodidymelliopsis sp. IMI 364377]
MDSLPQELVDRISHCLSRQDLRHILFLNKAFNAAAERLSGKFDKFEVYDGNLPKFIGIYGGARLRLLREIVFRLRFPPILDKHDHRPACRESIEELHQKNKLFTDQISLLFSSIQEVEQRAGASNPGQITLTIYGPTRRIERSLARVCLHRQYISWRIQLLFPEILPELRSVQAFQLNQGTYTYTPGYVTEISKLDLRMLGDLANKFPNLGFVGCQLGKNEICPTYVGKSQFWSHYERDYEGPRRDTRHNFANAFKISDRFLLLKRAQLDFIADYAQQLESLDQVQNMPDLTSPAKRDPFSTALGVFSHNLRILELRAMVDKSLFEFGENDSTPWPNLESLVVMFWPVSPSGAWYFRGPNGEGKHVTPYTVTTDHYPPLKPNANDFVHDKYLEENSRQGDDLHGGSEFRTIPDRTIMTPFLTAFAKAASRMPKLKDANIWSPLIIYQNDTHDLEQWQQQYQEYEDLFDSRLAWGIAYDKPSGGSPRQLTWRVSVWRPDEELHRLFQNIGQKEHGYDLVEDWPDEQLGSRPVTREFFSDYEVLPRLERAGWT